MGRRYMRTLLDKVLNVKVDAVCSADLEGLSWTKKYKNWDVVVHDSYDNTTQRTCLQIV